jgi:hypothetical protein
MLPQYKIEMEGIGIRFKDVNEPKLAKVLRTKKPFRSTKPEARLSLYELPFIVFLTTLGKAQVVEYCIKNYLTKWKKLRAAILAGQKVNEQDVAVTFRLHFTDLPDDMKSFIKTGNVKAPPNDVLQKTLQEHIDRTQRKLDNFKKEMNVVYKQGGFRQGKRRKQPRFKIDSMALLLAHDVVRLQKPDHSGTAHKGKITSANFAALQSSLALFDHRKDQLKEIFNRAGLTRNPDFVENLLRSDMVSLEHFFEQYLKSKLKWLKDFKSKPEECYILRKAVKRLKPDSFTEWLKKLETEPVNLPRGLFAELITEAVKENFPQQFEKLQTETKQFNSTFLIQKFHEWNGDHVQYFYGLPKDAESTILSRLTKLLVPEKMRKPNPIGIPADKQKEFYDCWTQKPDLTTLYSIAKEYRRLAAKQKNENDVLVRKIDPITEKIRQLESTLNDSDTSRFKRENSQKTLAELRELYTQFQQDVKRKPAQEYDHKDNKKVDNPAAFPKKQFTRIVSRFDQLAKNIRHTKLQDIVLFYAAKELLEFDRLKIGVRLSDIRKDKFMLNEIRQLKWKFKIPSNPLSVQTDLEFTLTGEMKVKNFGNFRRIINDIRTPSFLRLYYQATGETKVDYDYLVKQFDEYDNGRKTVFETIHRFERNVIRQGLQRKKNSKYIDFFEIVNELPVSEADKYVLFTYRNAFSHQYYPEFVFNNAKAKITDSDELAKYEKHFAKESMKLTKPPKGVSLTQWVIECLVQIFSEVSRQLSNSNRK